MSSRVPDRNMTVAQWPISPRLRCVGRGRGGQCDDGLMGDAGQVAQVEPAERVGAPLNNVGEIGEHGCQLLDLARSRCG